MGYGDERQVQVEDDLMISSLRKRVATILMIRKVEGGTRFQQVIIASDLYLFSRVLECNWKCLSETWELKRNVNLGVNGNGGIAKAMDVNKTTRGFEFREKQ